MLPWALVWPRRPGPPPPHTPRSRALLHPPLSPARRSCPEPTPLHEDALAVVALHVGPAAASVPKAQSFALLYHVLEIIPAYR